MVKHLAVPHKNDYEHRGELITLYELLTRNTRVIQTCKPVVAVT